MAVVKLLKVNTSTGRPRQHNTSADELEMLTLKGGNLKLAANTLSSDNTDGDINIEPNGTGDVIMQGLTYPAADGSANQFLQTNGAGTLSFATPSNASSSQVCNDYTADEALAAVDAVYISAADNVSKADASSEATARVIGFNNSGVVADTGTAEICSEGVHSGFTGLTPGATYFLSETAGLITTTPPSADESVVVQVGYAKSATELHIHIEVINENEQN